MMTEDEKAVANKQPSGYWLLKNMISLNDTDGLIQSDLYNK